MMHLNKQVKVLTGMLVMAITMTTYAIEAHDCVSINNDISTIKALKKSGKYRVEFSAETVPFDFGSNHNYQHYLQSVRQWIEDKNPKAHLKCPITTEITPLLYADKKIQDFTVTDLVSPFELQVNDNKVGVLLIHGLTDSPFLFHDLAAKFYDQGINVRTLLLPGHGTAPSALIDTEYHEWQAATKYAINQMLKDYQQVYLGGFSTGGALIIDHLVNQAVSRNQQQKIKGMLLWSPASKAKSNVAWLAQYVDYIPWLDYVNKGADIDFAKYESFPFNAGAQVHKLMNRISAKALSKKSLPDIPLFIVTSNVDQTISSQATVDLYNVWHKAPERSSAKHDGFVLFAERTGVLTIPDNLPITTMACGNLDTCTDVVDIAHTSPTNAPSNKHYGQHGSYRNCQHILDEDAFTQCKSSANNKLGEVSSENTNKYPHLQRLTYNPMFEQTWLSIQSFIERTAN